MSDRGAHDSGDALGRNRKSPMRLLGQDQGPPTIASGVHDTLAADIEGSAIKPLSELAVIFLLELSQHGRVVGKADLALWLVGLSPDFQGGSVVPVDREWRQQAARRNIPADHAGLRILLPVAAYRAKTFDARGLARFE